MTFFFLLEVADNSSSSAARWHGLSVLELFLLPITIIIDLNLKNCWKMSKHLLLLKYCLHFVLTISSCIKQTLDITGFLFYMKCLLTYTLISNYCYRVLIFFTYVGKDILISVFKYLFFINIHWIIYFIYFKILTCNILLK